MSLSRLLGCNSVPQSHLGFVLTFEYFFAFGAVVTRILFLLNAKMGLEEFFLLLTVNSHPLLLLDIGHSSVELALGFALASSVLHG